MSLNRFSLEDVLGISQLHPFYDSRVEYPPSAEDIKSIRESAAKDGRTPSLLLQPLLMKTSM